MHDVVQLKCRRIGLVYSCIFVTQIMK